jgi:cob(I)alamin adenosyltransferase
MARALVRHQPFQSISYAVQQDIFAAAAELASVSRQLPSWKRRVGREEIDELERRIDTATRWRRQNGVDKVVAVFRVLC